MVEETILPSPASAPVPKPQSKPPSHPEIKDNTREIVETIVFVVVLVLLLKTFVAEAFVIPTGSMAETLYGYQKMVTCTQCAYKFPVNCSSEVEERPPTRVTGCICPNCRHVMEFAREGMNPTCSSGDRVLVDKSLYDTKLADFKPFDVVVFKFPEEPQHNHTPMNYIKRLIGLPGQTIGIYYGDLYIATDIKYDDQDASTLDDAGRPLPTRRQTHKGDDKAGKSLKDGDAHFQILRKPPEKILALRRLVYDNDHQASDLVHSKFPPRWASELEAAEDEANDELAYLKKRKRAAQDVHSWKANDAGHGFVHPGGEDKDISWLRYRHLLRSGMIDAVDPHPELVTDFMGYNAGIPGRGGNGENWVGDLLLECQVTVDQTEGELLLELAKGVDRFQARFNLATGTCALFRITTKGAKKEMQELASKTTKMNKPGTYSLRFANFDRRLTLWINGDLAFDQGVPYDPPREAGGERPLWGPLRENDLEPASIGARGAAVSVERLKLWRDTYYTTSSGGRDTDALTLFVQPGHYLCMGDNSPQSSDSRTWDRLDRKDGRGGLVPERLMLGRALMVYWPLARFSLIR